MGQGILLGIFSEAFWYIAPIIINIVTFITGFFIKIFGVEKRWVKQVISWAIATFLSVGSWLLNFIAFGDPAWLGVIALSVVTGLSSNGYYEIGVIKSFIKKITGQEVIIS